MAAMPHKGLMLGTIVIGCFWLTPVVSFTAVPVSSLSRLSSPHISFRQARLKLYGLPVNRLSMQVDSSERTDLSTEATSDEVIGKGFSNRRELQKSQAQLRQRSKKEKTVIESNGESPVAEVAPMESKNSEQRDPQRVANPRTLESLKDSAMLEKERRLQSVKQAGFPMIDKVGGGLPLIEKARQIPDELLFGVERALLLGVAAAAAAWILAGAGTAYDAYMVATKQTVPAGVDAFLSAYVEPLLTPGLGVILLFSVMLGVLQVYKFEGGRAAVPPPTLPLRRRRDADK